MTDLDRLIESVEHATDGGNSAALINNRIARTANDNGEYWPGHYVMKAFDGSLDAAKSLHESLLPGYRWSIQGDTGHASVWGADSDGAHTAPSNPARAWLIAALKAYRSLK